MAEWLEGQTIENERAILGLLMPVCARGGGRGGMAPPAKHISENQGGAKIDIYTKNIFRQKILSWSYDYRLQ